MNGYECLSVGMNFWSIYWLYIYVGRYTFVVCLFIVLSCYKSAKNTNLLASTRLRFSHAACVTRYLPCRLLITRPSAEQRYRRAAVCWHWSLACLLSSHWPSFMAAIQGNFGMMSRCVFHTMHSQEPLVSEEMGGFLVFVLKPTSVRRFKHDNEPSGFMKSAKFVDQQSGCLLLKKVAYNWNCFGLLWTR
jgi:hypothetical protein